MKKSVLITAMMLCLYSFSEAQTFNVANSDGVEIAYSVVNDSSVRVMGNVYSGRVVVPESVTYEGTTYTVTQVANRAFMNCSVTYVELPSTLENIGIQVFFGSTLDTLYLKCTNPPLNLYGNDLSEETVRNLFGSAHFDTLTIIVPANQLQLYRYSVWGLAPYLTAPGAVPVTMYAPKKSTLVLGYMNLKEENAPAAYVTRNFEIGEKNWIACYPSGNDTLFLGWDKGDVYYTEITGPDTLKPVFARVGYGILGVNNVSTPVKFTGQMGYNNSTANYFVPTGSSQSPLFSNGLWISGNYMHSEDYFSSYVKTILYKCAGDFVPGPLTIDGQCRSDLETRKKFNRVWTVSREDIDDFIANVGTEGYSIPDDILTWPGNGDEGYAQQLAPYYDADSDGMYNPHHGDYPIIKGDKMIFSIFNDVTVSYNTGSDAMGYEIHMSAYAFNEAEDTALNNTVFMSYKIFNRSDNDYTHSYIGAFTDFDIGNGGDDYIACDVKNSMAYGFNGGSYDNVYQSNPPAQGCIMLAGPYADPDNIDNPKIDIAKMQIHYPDQLATYQLPDGSYDIPRLTADADLYYPLGWNFVEDYNYLESNTLNASINGMNYGNGVVDDERLGMCSFMAFSDGSGITGVPSTFSDYLCSMTCHWKDGQHLKYGYDGYSITNSIPCKFMFPGDSDPLHWGTGGNVPSINPDDWYMASSGINPSDCRGLQTSGPFTFEAGETNTLDLAFTTAFSNNDSWSVANLRNNMVPSLRRQFIHDTTDSGRPFTYMPYSAPIADIAGTPSQPSMRLYPNPARSLVSIALGEGAATDIQVYDMRGNRMMTVAKAQGTVSLDISSLPNGVYIVRCGTAVERLVKM